MSDKPLPPVPGGGAWDWDAKAQAWTPVTPEQANAALDAAAAPTPAAAVVAKPKGEKP